MRQLIGDENFITLLRAEAIVDMPKTTQGPTRLGDRPMSNSAVKAAFEKQIVVLPLDIIVSTEGGHQGSSKWRVL